MEGVSLNSEPPSDDETEEFDTEGYCAMTEFVNQNGVIDGNNPMPPAVGMEFESYEDVYFFYNCYAKQQGFGVRVSNTWYRKSRERYRAKLSCSSAGFKKKSEANRPRPEIRTGCPAMIKFRLMENKRWRIIESELGHNHLINPTSGKFYKSYKTMGLGTKRPSLDNTEEVQKGKLFKTVVNDDFYVSELDFANKVEQSNQLKLKVGDAKAIYNSFCQLQLMNPDFFYVMDLNEKGRMRNMFWADSNSRASFNYFGDVISVDTLCLVEKYEVPLVVFTGLNHHGQSVQLGCGLVSGETEESYTWLFRAWLTFMLGRPPQVIIIEQSKSLKTALTDVFPRALHCISLSDIVKKLPEKLHGFAGYEEVYMAFIKAVYHSIKAEDFELAWENMIVNYGLMDHKWLQTIYIDCKTWVPAYLKDTFLAGMFPFKQGEEWAPVFEGYLRKDTSIKEFFDDYYQISHEILEREALADIDSSNSGSIFMPICSFELQLSKVYTNGMLKKFQVEAEGMFSCFNTRQVGVDGSFAVYLMEEHVENRKEPMEYEVLYNSCAADVQCVCGLFNFKGYLCRHALNVLHINGVEEIPSRYILSRWRKDIYHNHGIDQSCHGVDLNNPVHRFDDLYKRVLQVVEKGSKSQEKYKFALQALDEILSKVRLVDDKPI